MYQSLIFATLMAIIDLFVLGFVKMIPKIGEKWMFLPTFVYAIQPWLFLDSLKYSNLTIMNFMWDIMSGVIVTLGGVYFFNETITGKQKLGILTSFISLYLFI
jgi:drug/metabolite transporter (DMT)-like permease